MTMATNITVPSNFGALPSVLKNHVGVNRDELGGGITTGFAVIGYRGKVWSTKYQGVETALMRADGDGARASIDVVIIKTGTGLSKIYYAGGYVEGSTAAPDCWSNNGVTPDASVQKKVSPNCASCPKNVYGSRTTDSGAAAKACTDSKRMAIVPLDDIDNEIFGGPMLMRVPAASLKMLRQYADRLEAAGYPFYGVGTRISFDVKEAYPKFEFKEIRPLTEDEARKILALRDDIRVHRILNTEQHMIGESEAPEAAPAQGVSFIQPTPAPAPAPTPAPAPVVQPVKVAPVTPKVDDTKSKAAKAKAEAARLAAEAAAAAAALAAAEAEEDEEETSTDDAPQGQVPGSIEAMLDSLLPSN